MYTEQQIRGLAINFLRQHYKLRPRSGTSGTRVVHKPHYYEGVTIDARLAYQKPDLSWFTATVEASGVNQAHEVLYRVNYFRIGVHALVIALIILGAFLALTQVQGENLWAQYGRPQVYLFLLNIFIVVFAVAGVLLSRLKYYRYIYAIAQFMRFHADAQWVAYDYRIFAEIDGDTRRQAKRKERYYEELQRQCLRFGFGLMEVNDNNKVRWLIEPSHIDQFAGRRSRLPQWVAAATAGPPVLQGLRNRLPLAKPAEKPAPAPPVPTDGTTDPLAVENYLPLQIRKEEYAATVVPAKKGRTPWFKRPARLSKSLRWKARHAIRLLYPDEIRKRPGYYELPWWVVLTGLAAFATCLTIGIWQAEWTPERLPHQVEAAPDLSPLEPSPSAEQSDAEPGVLDGEYDHTLSASEAAARPGLNLTPERPDEPVVEAASPPVNTIHYLRYAPSGTIESSYGCGPVSRLDTLGYLLLEGRYPVYDLALERAANLNANHAIPTAVLLADCLQEGAPGYLLYLGDPTYSRDLINTLLLRYLRDFGLETEVVEVRE
ncbi:MAG: hypothetical protein AAF840_00230 [Bacteroidota bacterium]